MTELPKREFGHTGLQVTTPGYGAMELRGAPRGRDVTEEQAETILRAVLDAGINYIDTSMTPTELATILCAIIDNSAHLPCGV